jgi:hypothetical protein
MKYLDEAKRMWRAFVPAKGQASTVQGELLRAVEKLRDEAMRNGNANWDEGFETLARFVRETLVAPGTFDATASAEIESDLARVSRPEPPVVDAGVFDHLADRVVEWYRSHPEPIPRTMDPTLRR